MLNMLAFTFHSNSLLLTPLLKKSSSFSHIQTVAYPCNEPSEVSHEHTNQSTAVN